MGGRSPIVETDRGDRAVNWVDPASAKCPGNQALRAGGQPYRDSVKTARTERAPGRAENDQRARRS